MRSRPLVRVLGVAFIVAALWFFAQDLYLQRAEIGALWRTLHPSWSLLGASGLVVLASYAVLIETWRRTVEAWGSGIAWSAAARIWFVSNLGKYIPGKVWQIGAMSVLSERQGVSAVAAVGSSLVVNLVNLLAGFLIVLLTGSRLVPGENQLLIAVVAATLVAMATPWLLPVAARVASRILGRKIEEPRVPPRAIFLALGGCLVAWALYGLAFQLLDRALFGASTSTVTSGTSASYIAVFTLSYVAGYLFLPAPGGIGVREDMLKVLLPAAGIAAGPHALVLVLVSRLWLTVLEAAPGLVLLLVRRSSPSIP